MTSLPIGELPPGGEDRCRPGFARRWRHARVIDPTLGKLYPFEDVPQAHYEMEEGIEVFASGLCSWGPANPDWGGSETGDVTRTTATKIQLIGGGGCQRDIEVRRRCN